MNYPVPNNKWDFHSANSYWSVEYLTTDADVYYKNETIKINASWSLFYDQMAENAFMQVRILNPSYGIIWNSSEFHEQGMNIQKTFNLSVQELSLYLQNCSAPLTVTIFYYYFSYLYGDIWMFYNQNKTISVLGFGFFNLNSFTSNKDLFYSDEYILLLTSWDLLYDIEKEVSYLQICIYNSSNQLLWNSSILDNNGINIENYFNISLNDLELYWNDSKQIINISLFYYYDSFRSFSMMKYSINLIIISRKQNLADNNFHKKRFIFFTIISVLSSILLLVISFLYVYSRKNEKHLEDIIIKY